MNETLVLPKILRTTVNEVLDLLGQAIKIEYGDNVFEAVESIRSRYKDARRLSPTKKLEIHTRIYNELKGRNKQKKFKIAHSFATSLELINACENAYRSYRLEMRPDSEIQGNGLPTTFVLTAHPTEARSAECLALLQQITTCLFESFKSWEKRKAYSEDLFHLILLFLKVPMSKTKSPTVSDEAEYIYSTVFQEANIKLLADLYNQDHPIFIRTWVGGDKDGHPGVNEKVMISSLTASRRFVIRQIADNIDRSQEQLKLLQPSRQLKTLTNRLRGLKKHLKTMQTVKDGDAKNIKRFNVTLSRSAAMYKNVIGLPSPELDYISTLVKIFPGLCVPLELREDSEVIHKACKDSKLAIFKMLATLRKVAQGGSPAWYARGFVISMCESFDDVQAAEALMGKSLKSLKVPIIPLFETREALQKSYVITKEMIQSKSYRKAIEKNWDSKLEIMLGYSDSAKESGALYSRVMIRKTVSSLNNLILKHKLTPIFFHGSGGSVARGGGSLQEQISWWPKSARERFKATIQGEMVYRTFSSAPILKKQIEKIRSHEVQNTGNKVGLTDRNALLGFAEAVREEYSNKVNDPDFLEIVRKATPYEFLDQLKIGSRPSKRKKTFDLSSLRAIPWVLCWTQTRALFPVWWGIGKAWTSLSETERSRVKSAYEHDDLLRSFIKTLAYSLAKVDLSVWFFYLKHSDISESQYAEVTKEFKREFLFTREFVKEISGEDHLLWFKPWLSESIMLRSTMIYPLNLLEVEAIRRDDMPLLRETVTGVASGMLTTG